VTAPHSILATYGNSPIRSILILNYEGTGSKLQFQTPKLQTSMDLKEAGCPMSIVQCPVPVSVIFYMLISFAGSRASLITWS